MLQMKKDIAELKKMKKTCHDSLKTAKALFPTNPELKNVEKEFQKLVNHVDAVERYYMLTHRT